MNLLTKLFGLFVMVLFLSQCKDVFIPDVDDQPTGYLVVEGFINIEGLTTIKLTRTRGLQATDTVFENGATLVVETEGGDNFPLQFAGKGLYQGMTVLQTGAQVRLRMITANGRTYASEFVESKNTPEIDSINWEQRDDGVHVFVNTHDEQNQTHYYFWQFEETWHFRSLYQSYYEYIGPALHPDSPDFKIREIDVHNCWTNQRSTGIYLANTKGLTEDRIVGHRMIAIPNASEKLGIRYSILVKQYALTSEAYHYWDMLRKNTEDIGGIFDPQPSSVIGNIRNINDPDDLVVGFISVASPQYKRIFIGHEELSDWVIQVDAYEECVFTQAVPSEFEKYFRLRGYIPILPIYNALGQIGAFTATFNECGDCTLRGANVKPEFWSE